MYDQCAFCFLIVAQSQKMDLVRVNGREVCTHPGNCTQNFVQRHKDAKVVNFGVRAQNGVVLQQSRRVATATGTAVQ